MCVRVCMCVCIYIYIYLVILYIYIVYKIVFHDMSHEMYVVSHVVTYCEILLHTMRCYNILEKLVCFCLILFGGVLDRHHISLKLPQIGSRLETSSTCTAKISGNLRFSIEPTRDPMVSYISLLSH